MRDCAAADLVEKVVEVANKLEKINVALKSECDPVNTFFASPGSKPDTECGNNSDLSKPEAARTVGLQSISF